MMSDKEHIPQLIEEASTDATLHDVQRRAARKLLEFDREVYPADGCAITLSLLLQGSGIDVPDTFLAMKLGHILHQDRHWSVIPVGEQQAGDVGSTCGEHSQHGVDHIYLVLRRVNADEMIIADNQHQHPHFRWASGQGGKSPTRFFLRAT
jgi:hypothetical protein